MQYLTHFITIYIVTIFSIGSVYSQTLQDSLVLYYQFNGDLNDSTANAYNGSSNGAVMVPDKFGNTNSAVHFSGGNQSIDFPDLEELNVDGPKTFSVWIKIDSMPYRGMALFCTDYHSTAYYGYHSMLSPSISIGNATSLSPSGRLTYISERELFPNIWYHLVFVYNGIGSADIYMYGQLMNGAFSGSASTIEFSNNEGKLGQVDNNTDTNPSYASFYGTMDDFMIWNRALSAAEVSQLYNLQQ